MDNVNLNELEQQIIAEAKALEAKFIELVAKVEASRELSLAKTKLQEALMWFEAHFKAAK